MKDAIIKDLNELAKAGIRKTINVVEAIREGKFDTEIEDFSNMSVSEAADLICQLADLRNLA